MDQKIVLAPRVNIFSFVTNQPRCLQVWGALFSTERSFQEMTRVNSPSLPQVVVRAFGVTRRTTIKILGDYRVPFLSVGVALELYAER